MINAHSGSVAGRPRDIAEVYRIAQEFKAQHGVSPAGIKMSRATCHLFTKDLPLLPTTEPSQTIYGLPLVLDESVPLGELRIVSPKT